MPLDFPASPSLNDTYSFGGKTWRWNGSGWQLSTGGGAINDIPIGNVTPSTGAFTAVSATGNVTAGNVLANAYYFANGDPFTSGGSNVDLTAVASNITPTANVTYDIGSTSLRFRDIYLANSTIHLGSQQISASGNGLVLPNTVQIGNSTIDGSSGGLILPGDTSIGGATAATPRIASIDYPGDDTAADPAGGQTLGIVGSGFFSGVTVILDGVTISPVTLVSSTRLEITAPAKSAGSYTLYVINSDGGTGIYVPGVQYSGLPTWSSPSAGSLGTIYETANVSATFSATSDSAVTYSLLSGTLPAGSSLDTNTGVLSGTANLIAGSSVTYSFTVRATDAENQDTDRAFSLTVDADSVTWSSPTDGNTVSITVDQASTTTLSAASAAGDSISYSANALPTGLTLTGNTISGTANVVANTSVALTATADTTTRSATVTVTFVVALPLGDEYFKSTTLLLNADDNTFITDASDNAFTITPNGDTRPSAFSPYNTSWSNYFDGNGDYLSVADNAALDLGSSDFTIECWINPTSVSLNSIVFSKHSSSTGSWIVYRNGTTMKFYCSSDGSNWNIVNGATIGTISANNWYHIEITRDGSSFRCFLNGVLGSTTTSSSTVYDGTQAVVLGINPGSSTDPFNGYISNARIVKGTALHTSNFTPSTTPLTAISGTSLLTCQSNRLVDNSPNNFAITKSGDTKVMSFGPFSTDYRPSPDSYSVAFDGNGDYITGPTGNSTLNTALDILGSDYTMEWWMFKTANTAQKIVTNFTASGGNGFDIITREDGGIAITTWTNNSPSGLASTFGNYNLNEWVHVAIVKDSGSYYFYINGKEVGIFQGGSRTAPANPGAGTGLAIGVYIQNLGYPAYFTGLLSNLRITKGVVVYTGNFVPPTGPLSTTQSSGTNIAAITNSSSVSLLACQSSTIVDNSDNGFTLSTTGQAHPVIANPFDGSPLTYSGYLDGNGDYLKTEVSNSLLLGSSDFTMEAWIYPPTGLVNGTYEQSIISSRSGGVYDGVNLQFNTTAVLVASSSGSWGMSIVITSTVKNTLYDKWTHVALTREGSTFRLFFDGVQVGTSTYSGSIYQSEGSFHIGRGGYWFGGYISNARIVVGNAVYTSNFTPSTTPLTAISGTSLLTCQSPGFIDNSSNAFAITVNGNAVVKPNNPFGYNETTQTAITDTTGSGYFDGSGDYLSVPASSTFTLGTSDHTIEFWMYANGAQVTQYSTQWEYASGAAQQATNDYYFQASPTDGGSFALLLGAGGSWAFIINGGAAKYNETINRWNHIAITRQGNTFRLFMNGLLVGSATSSVSIGAQSGEMRIGSDNSTNYHKGWISDFRFVKGTAVYTANFTPPTAPLTAIANTSLLTLQNRIGYNNRQPIDESGIKNVITRNGNASAGTFSPHVPAGWSGYFDGTGDFLSVASTSDFAFGTSDFTIEGWWYLDRLSSGVGDNNTFLLDFRNNTSAGAVGTLYIDVGGASSALRWYANGAVRITGGVLSVSSWNHIVICRSSGSTRMFINGALQGSVFSDSINYVAAPLTISREFDGTNNRFVNGYISNLRIVKGTALYTSNFTPPTAPLKPVTNTSFLTLRGPGFTDDGPNRLAITRNGDTKITPVSPFAPHTIAPDSHSVYFDGTGDYLTMPSSSTPLSIGSSDDFTIECWVYRHNNNNSIFKAASGSNGLQINSSNYAGYWLDGTGEILTSTTALSESTWYHLAYVRNNGTWYLYVNGNQEDTYGPYAIAIDFSTWTIAKGVYNNLFTGYVSNFRIVKGVAVYTGNFTPPSESLTVTQSSGTNIAAITGTSTSLLTCQSSTVIDNSTNELAITVNGNSQPTQFNPFGETVTTGVEYLPVTHGGSVYFDGSGDYLYITDPSVKFDGDFTIEAWVYNISGQNTQGLLNTQPHTTLAISMNRTGVGDTYVYIGNGSSWLAAPAINSGTSGKYLKHNSWNHVALVRYGNTITLYQNGEVAGTTTTLPSGFNGGLYIGSVASGSPSEYLKGWISGLNMSRSAIYTSAFVPSGSPSATKADSVVHIKGTNAAIQDRSGRNVLETVGNARVLNGVKKYGTGAMSFDGTGDYLLIPDSDGLHFGSGDFTAECWVYPTASPNQPIIMGQWSGSTGSTTLSWVILLSNNSSRFLRFALSTNGSGVLTDSISSSALTLNDWNHIALVRNGDVFTAYLNGTSAVTYTITAGAALYNATNQLSIGASSAGTQPFQGFIDDLRVTRGVARYTGNFTPPTATFELK